MVFKRLASPVLPFVASGLGALAFYGDYFLYSPFRFWVASVSSLVDLFRCFAPPYSQIPWAVSPLRDDGRRERDEFGLAGLFGLRFSLPAILVLVWGSCFVLDFSACGLQVWVRSGVGNSSWRRVRCWEFVRSWEAGQSSVRSGGSLVLSLGYGFGGFRLKCLRVWYHQNQIVSP